VKALIVANEFLEREIEERVEADGNAVEGSCQSVRLKRRDHFVAPTAAALIPSRQTQVC
jgi:hypothetical protein